MRALTVILPKVLLLLAISYPAAAQVAWVRKYDDALNQAKSAGKLIVVDIFADWCPPCQKMAQQVYPNPEFIAFSRSQIYMLLDGEKDSDGMSLGRRFGVNSFPTILVLDSKGQEISRLTGGRDVKSLIRDLQAIFDDPRPYGDLVKFAREDTGNYALQFRAGQRAYERNDFALARQFLSRAADKPNKDIVAQSASLLMLTMACFKDGKYPEALAALDALEKLAPDAVSDNSEMKLLRGRILISAKRHDEGFKVLNDLLRTSRSRKEIDDARTALSQLPGKYRKGDKELGSILDKARQEVSKGKMESALSYAEKASDVAPQAAEVHLLLAYINFKRGESNIDASKKSQYLSAGLNELRLARRLDPEDMSIFLEAKGFLASKYLPQVPESPSARKIYAEAETRFAEGRYGEAAKAYLKTIELEPAFGKAYLHCGDCLFVNGNIDEALKMYQAAISKSPVDASAYRFAADALQKLGKPDEAKRYLISSLLADPEYPMIWSILEQQANREGKRFQRHSDLVPIQFLLLSLDTNAYGEELFDSLPPQTVPAWREYVRSKLLWRQEKFANRFPKAAFYHTSFEEELESLQAAITKWNSSKEQNSSLTDESLDFLRQISVDGQLPAFIYLELFTEEYRNTYEQWKRENRQAALEYIQTYLTGRAGVPMKGGYNASAIEAYNNALASSNAGDNEKAVSLYLKALAQEPGMIPALRNVTILYMRMGDFVNAQEPLKKWASLEPESAEPYMMLSQIQYRDKNYEEALESAEKALNLEKDPARKEQAQKVASQLRSRLGVSRNDSPNAQSREADARDGDDKLTSLENRLKALPDGDEKDSLILMLAVAHFEAKHWEKAGKYASMMLAKDPAQPTAKAILDAVHSKK